MDILHVDCNRCAVRGSGCADCVISVLLGVPSGGTPAVDLAAEEQAALAALAASGLVPPLRLVDSPPVGGGGEAESQPWLETRIAE